jgi:gamma-glutamyltranspeptidase / glutathione hydrolase
MRGAISAGHAKTVEAGIRMFACGGNAFDAVLAAFAAACVAEPVLTSLGGGGFLLARTAGKKAPMLYDFFVQTPRRCRPAAETEFYPIIADFGVAQQEFHIGCGAIATPGGIRGLTTCHARLGRLPFAQVLEPAIEYARDGVLINPLQAYIFGIVAPTYRSTPAAEAVYGSALERPGALFTQPALAQTLAWLAAEGDRPFYDGEIAQRLARFSDDQGGHLALDDLAAYRVIERTPLAHRYRGFDVTTNPPPSSGGLLTHFALTALEEQPLAGLGFGSPAHLRHLAAVMTQTNLARAGGLVDRDAHDRAVFEACLAEIRAHPTNNRGTTHISAIDEAGNCASLTASNGEGCGHLLPDTGIMLNNMLGEEDLNPLGFHCWPCDRRVSSMMAPTLAEGGGRLVTLGSGGSNRLRTAILQTLSNMVDFAMPPGEAVAAPRIHVERGGRVDIEPGFPAAAVEALCADHPDSVVWDAPNLFFGGTHTVCWDGREFTGAGDPRRGGVFAVSG